MVGQSERLAQPLTRRQKRVMIAVVAAVLVAVVGISLWSVLHGDAYGASHDGCVNVVTPSTLGAATLHACGTAGAQFCAQEFAASDPLSRYAIPQCRLAGYRPPAAAPA